MSKKDPRIDAYILKSADFARPVLTHFRTLVHKACPDVEETIKWGMPHFEYKGVICHLAAFKQHCSLGFWNAPAMSDPHQLLNAHGKTAMGHLGIITSLSDLPDDAILVHHERHDAARAVIGRPGDDCVAAAELAIDDVVGGTAVGRIAL